MKLGAFMFWISGLHSVSAFDHLTDGKISDASVSACIALLLFSLGAKRAQDALNAKEGK